MNQIKSKLQIKLKAEKNIQALCISSTATNNKLIKGGRAVA